MQRPVLQPLIQWLHVLGGLLKLQSGCVADAALLHGSWSPAE